MKKTKLVHIDLKNKQKKITKYKKETLQLI